MTESEMHDINKDDLPTKDLCVISAIEKCIQSGDFRFVEPYVHYCIGKPKENINLEAEKPIVFDIFPQEIGGGYFFDFTRTVCFGSAPKSVKTLYDTVSGAYDYACSLLKVGRRTRDIEQKVCEFFERKGLQKLLIL